jgi:hypothetical protein
MTSPRKRHESATDPTLAPPLAGKEFKLFHSIAGCGKSRWRKILRCDL